MNALDQLSKYFIITLVAIVSLGVIMVYSSSYIFAKELYGSSAHFFIRQLIFVFIGFISVFIISKTKLNFWLKYFIYFHWFIVFLLFLTFIPGVALTVKGASRWIDLGFFSLQPGEFIKYSLIVVAISFFENFMRMNSKDRIKYIVSILVPMTLLLQQPDFGAFTICFIVIGFVSFMSSFPRKYLWILISGGTIVSLVFLFTESYRVNRLLAFLDPWKNPQTTGF